MKVTLPLRCFVQDPSGGALTRLATFCNKFAAEIEYEDTRGNDGDIRDATPSRRTDGDCAGSFRDGDRRTQMSDGVTSSQTGGQMGYQATAEVKYCSRHAWRPTPSAISKSNGNAAASDDAEDTEDLRIKRHRCSLLPGRFALPPKLQRQQPPSSTVDCEADSLRDDQSVSLNDSHETTNGAAATGKRKARSSLSPLYKRLRATSSAGGGPKNVLLSVASDHDPRIQLMADYWSRLSSPSKSGKLRLPMPATAAKCQWSAAAAAVASVPFDVGLPTVSAHLPIGLRPAFEERRGNNQFHRVTRPTTAGSLARSSSNGLHDLISGLPFCSDDNRECLLGLSSTFDGIFSSLPQLTPVHAADRLFGRKFAEMSRTGVASFPLLNDGSISTSPFRQQQSSSSDQRRRFPWQTPETNDMNPFVDICGQAQHASVIVDRGFVGYEGGWNDPLECRYSISNSLLPFAASQPVPAFQLPHFPHRPSEVRVTTPMALTDHPGIAGRADVLSMRPFLVANDVAASTPLLPSSSSSSSVTALPRGLDEIMLRELGIYMRNRLVSPAARKPHHVGLK